MIGRNSKAPPFRRTPGIIASDALTSMAAFIGISIALIGGALVRRR